MEKLSRYARVLYVAFEMTYRQLVLDSFLLFATFLMPLIYALLGLWMLREKGDNYAIFVVIGSGLTGLWSTMLFSSGNAITGERWTGTLETVIAAPTPVSIVVFGKNLANVVQALASMLASYILVSILFHYPLSLAEPALFFISLAFGVISLVCFGLILAPAFILNPQIGRFQNAMEYPVYILSGFMFPIALLPDWTTPFSYLLAPYWAARALHASSSGTAEVTQIAFYWSMMVVLSVAYVIVSAFLFQIALRKARVDGTLMKE